MTKAAEKMLEHLLDLSMAQTGRRAGRYRLHSLLRDFAREQCGETLDDAELRMATYYCELANYFGPRLHGGEGLHEADVMDALRVLEIGDVVTCANNYWGLGRVYEEQNDFARAFEWCNRAMEIWVKIGSLHAKTYHAHLEELKAKLKDMDKIG